MIAQRKQLMALAAAVVAAIILVLAANTPASWATESQSPVRQSTVSCPSGPELVSRSFAISVDLQRPNAPAPDPSWAVGVQLSLHPLGVADMVCHAWDLTLDESGTWTGELEAYAGLYDVRLKNAHTLRNVRRDVEISTTNHIDMGTLLEGDANGDNQIRITDFGLLRNAYFTEETNPDYDPRADFDENGEIRVRDFSLLRSNYFLEGDVEVGSEGFFAHDLLCTLGTTARRPQLGGDRRGSSWLWNLAGARESRLPQDALGSVGISVEPPTTTLEVGSEGVVTVTLHAGEQEVVGADFDLRFDPRFVEVVDALPDDGGVQVEPVGPLDWVAGNRMELLEGEGRILYGASTIGDPVSGEVPLARIHLKGAAATSGSALYFDSADVIDPGTISVMGDATGGTLIVDDEKTCYLPLVVRVDGGGGGNE